MAFSCTTNMFLPKEIKDLVFFYHCSHRDDCRHISARLVKNQQRLQYLLRFPLEEEMNLCYVDTPLLVHVWMWRDANWNIWEEDMDHHHLLKAYLRDLGVQPKRLVVRFASYIDYDIYY